MSCCQWFRTLIGLFVLLGLAACGGGGGGTGGPANQLPVFESASVASLVENYTRVITVTASDANGDTLSYSLTGGTDQAAFAIDAASGVLSFASAPDYEAPADSDSNNVYEVQVSVSDGKDSVAQTINITVTNENDIAPVLTSATSVTVFENVSSVMTVTATDEDGDTPTYQVVGGTDQNIFTIDSASGALTFKQAPDYENPSDNNADHIYDVWVRATDGVNSTTEVIAVTVGNVDEIAPVFTSSNSVNVVENRTTVITVVATDTDGSGAVSYTLSGGTDQTAFVINSNDGALSFVTAPDYEVSADANNDNIYQVQVTASDGINSALQMINVTVTDLLDEVAPFVTSVSPADGETNIAVSSAVSVTFNEDIDCATANVNSLTVTGEGSGPISGKIVCGANVVSFTRLDLLPLDRFSVTATTEITDLSGNPLSSDFQSGFATRPWTVQFGTTADDKGESLVVDQSTNDVYVTGTTSGDLNGQTNAGTGTLDVFVSKYNKYGVHQWTRLVGTQYNEYVNGIVRDSAGNLYIAGRTYGSLGAANAGNADIFIAKLDKSGVTQWIRQLGTSVGEDVYDITIDKSDNIYVAGDTNGDFDGQTSSGGTDIVIIKYASDGTKLWTIVRGTTGTDVAWGIDVQDYGVSGSALFVAGETTGSLSGVNAGGKDAFLIKYDLSGVHQWTRQIGTTADDVAKGVAGYGLDRIYIAGESYGDYDGYTNNSSGFSDAFVTEYNGLGGKNWSYLIGSTGLDMVDDIVVDANGKIDVVGRTNGNYDGLTNNALNTYDVFITQFSSVSGMANRNWSQLLGTTNHDLPNAIAIGKGPLNANEIYLTGETRSGLDGNTFEGGITDGFIARYSVFGDKY